MASYSRFGVGLAAMFRVWFEPDFARYYVAWLAGRPPGVPQPEVEPVSPTLVLSAPSAETSVVELSEKVKQPEQSPTAEAAAEGTATESLEKLKQPEEVPVASPAVAPSASLASESAGLSEDALLLLGLFQRDGRLIDFLEQDVVGFSDNDVGAAARLVHAGCRKVLHQYLTVKPLRDEAEGASVTLVSGYDPHEYKLVGDVPSTGNIQGRLRHPGWRATELKLPSKVGNVDLRVLAPAEVEI
jgi:hypothetical protein